MPAIFVVSRVPRARATLQRKVQSACVRADRANVRETSLGTKVPLINDSNLMAAI